MHKPLVTLMHGRHPRHLPYLVPMTLAIAAVVALHRRLDDAHGVILGPRQGEAAASDVDRECDSVIRTNFHDALHLPTMRELGPSLIRALEKSPVIWYQAGPYANAYRKTLARAGE